MTVAENSGVRNGQDERGRSKENEGQEDLEMGTPGFGYWRSPREYPSLRTKNPDTLDSRAATLDITACVREQHQKMSPTFFCLLLTEAKDDTCQGCCSVKPTSISLPPGIVELGG